MISSASVDISYTVVMSSVIFFYCQSKHLFCVFNIYTLSKFNLREYDIDYVSGVAIILKRRKMQETWEIST